MENTDMDANKDASKHAEEEAQISSIVGHLREDIATNLGPSARWSSAGIAPAASLHMVGLDRACYGLVAIIDLLYAECTRSEDSSSGSFGAFYRGGLFNAARQLARGNLSHLDALADLLAGATKRDDQGSVEHPSITMT
jgi:hypothetical protein